MHFGAVFIALIGFTIAMLLVPQFLGAAFRRNIEILSGSVRNIAQDRNALAGLAANDRDRAMELWEFLTQIEKDHRIKTIKWQKYVPYVSILIVIEVCVFALSSYYVSRGREVPGFVEDMAIVMVVLLVLVTLYAAYRVLRDNAHHTRYLHRYRDFMTRFRDDLVD